MARAALVLVLLSGTAACTTVTVSQPTLERDLSAALEGRRLDGVAERLIRFRNGILSEALDRGRLDRPDRAAAATRAAGDLRREIEGVHRGRLDREGRVDLDLSLFLLDQAAGDLRLADGAEERLARHSGDAAAAAFLAAPGPLLEEAGARLDALATGWFPAEAPIPGDAEPEDLRAAARRARQAGDLLRRRGMEAAILSPEAGAARKAAAEEAGKRADAFAGRLEEAAKEEKDGFRSPSGREAFVAALRTRHAVDASPDELEAFGQALLGEATAALVALAAAHFPGKDWKQALNGVRAAHPAAAEVPGMALAAAEAAREFCLERGLVGIPPAARLGHVEVVGDDMARSYPFAAYSYRRATAEGESGRYMVSPGATWMTPEQREERLGGSCPAWTRVVAPHETWPGHHLQFWVADNLCSALRREASTPVFVEGWGFYCEGLLEEHGFFKAPEERLCLLAMRAWRASRVVLDVRLHCGGCTPEQGVDFLVANAGLTRDAAVAEVRRYMGSPTQPFSYAWGAREIRRLRADEEKRLGPAFSDRAFHDRLLRCGPIPLPFVRRLFGYGE